MAQWSKIWGFTKTPLRAVAMQRASFTPPTVKAAGAGKFPHLQEFRRPSSRKQEQKTVTA